MNPFEKLTVELQRDQIGILLRALDITISQTPGGAANPYRDMQKYLQGVLDRGVFEAPTKYRIVDFQGTPLSGWTHDRAHLDEYVAVRDSDLGKQRVQSTDDPDYDPDSITSIEELDSLHPDPIAVWEGQCGYIGDLGIRQSDIDNEERFHEFEQAAEAAETQHDPNICRYCGSECTDFGKNEPTVYCHDCGREYREPEFMNEEELNARVVKRCPLGHSPRGTTFGGDALHHSCGCPVLKGEELV